MKQLTKEQFEEYQRDPLAADAKVRKWCNIPEDRYYNVSVWPEERSGVVRESPNLFRKVPVHKVSKSDQH